MNERIQELHGDKVELTGYLNHKQNLKWVGTFLFLSAAITLSANFEYSRYGFILFAIGHTILSVIFFTDKDKPMFFQNFVFLFIDAYGIYNYFIR